MENHFKEVPMRTVVLLVVFIVLGLGAAAYNGLQSDGEASVTVAEPPAEGEAGAKNEEAACVVYVCGEVNRPGVVKVAADARIMDAVKLCGGFLPNAAQDKVNLAQKVSDGMQIIVPAKNANGSEATGKKADDEQISINSASREELDKIPGVGPAMAQAIIDYREKQGAFQSVDDLKKIQGIGEKKFARMVNRVKL